MTITLNLQPEDERGLLAQAQLRGLSLQDYVEQIVMREAHLADAAAPAPPQGNLHEFFMNSPLRGAGLDLERAKDYPRAFEIE
jgi:hypothetical protein